MSWSACGTTCGRRFAIHRAAAMPTATQPIFRTTVPRGTPISATAENLETGAAELAAGTFPVTAPDAVLLPVRQRVLEALGTYRAAGTHLFGVGVLVAAGEELLRAHVFAAGLFTPVSHGSPVR